MTVYETSIFAPMKRFPKHMIWVAMFLLLAAVGCQDNASSGDPAKSVAPVGAEVEYTLEAYMSGYRGVGGEIEGKINPALKANAGDTVTLKLINKENMAHDIALDGQDVRTETAMKIDEVVEVTFVAKESTDYFCSLPGHRQAGMQGKFIVEGVAPQVAQNAPAVAGGAGSQLFPKTGTPLKPILPVSTDEISLGADTVPAPIGKRAPETVEFVINTSEEIAELEDGTTYEMWTFDGKVPGPMLRVREGDNVVIHLDNAPSSKMVHSIDFHAVTGPGGGAAVLQAPPGERRSMSFKAMKAGLYVYHCATPHIATHLARGMYGMILVEPEEGLPEVDREYYVMQGEYYTTERLGTEGHQIEDANRMLEEMPTYIVFNGRVGALTESRAMKAKVGETVRMYFGVGGPNKVSSMHVIGEIFDRVYKEADLISPPARNIQTTLVPAGGAVMVEFEVDYPGTYILVDHSLSRADKGAVAILEVEGEADDTIFKSLDGIKPLRFSVLASL